MVAPQIRIIKLHLYPLGNFVEGDKNYFLPYYFL